MKQPMKNIEIRNKLAKMVKAIRNEPSHVIDNPTRARVNFKLARDFAPRSEVIPVASLSFAGIAERVDWFCAQHSVERADVYLNTTTINVPYEEWEEDAIELSATTLETDQEWFARIVELHKRWTVARTVPTAPHQIKQLVEGPWEVNLWRWGQDDAKVVIQAAHGDADLALVLNGNFDGADCDQAKAVAEYLAKVLNTADGWRTADGVVVKPGDKVWVRGSSGLHETTVQKPVTTYELFGPIPVDQSYSTEQALRLSVMKGPYNGRG